MPCEDFLKWGSVFHLHLLPLREVTESPEERMEILITSYIITHHHPFRIINFHKMQGGRRNIGNRTLQGSSFPFKLWDTSEPLRSCFCSALVVTDRHHSSPTEQSLIFRCPFQRVLVHALSEAAQPSLQEFQRQRICVIFQMRKCKRTFIWKMKKR